MKFSAALAVIATVVSIFVAPTIALPNPGEGGGMPTRGDDW